MIEDAADNLYGTTTAGGGTCPGPGGTRTVCGTIFRLAPDGTESILYTFKGETDGWYPTGALLSDRHGNLFGTTELGGSYSAYPCQMNGCGTVFKLAPDGTKKTLYSFTGDADSQYPMGALIADKAGNLYGTTAGGGTSNGTVFKVAPDGTETVLYTFCSLT